MKKIGILTFHHSDSYGALLQTYSLRKVINTFENCKAEIINYIPSDFVLYPYENTEEGLENYIQKRIKFQNFMKEHCGVEGEPITKVDGKELDVCVVGSDQIWNSQIREATIQFFLPDVQENCKKVAYAASIGRDITESDFDKSPFEKYLPDFDDIAVREDECVEFISQASGKKCISVLDPTLLLDSQDFDELIDNEKKKDAPYLLFFWLNENEMYKGLAFANLAARKFNLEIVHFTLDMKRYMIYKDGGCIGYCGVEEFLWYVKNADMVVTDSYHGTIFSIQYRRPFYTFVNQKRRSRIDTLNRKLGLSDRLIESYMTISQINLSVNFERIWENINCHRKISMNYLKESLEVKNTYE